MSTEASPVISPERLAEASEWLVRLREEGASQEDMTAWLEWCTAHPQNLEAFDRAQSLLDGLKALPEATRRSFSSTVAERELPQQRRRMRKRALFAAALAAGIAALILVAGPWFAHPKSTWGEFATARAAQREVILADRSRITLGAASVVTARYSVHARHLLLRDGEAFFEVQPNHARPFVVDAGPLTVTAVGTKFDIRRTRQRVIVTVTQGIVNVAAEGSTVSVRVAAGQRAIQNVDSRLLTVSTADPKEALSWTSGRLEYVAEPLSSVIEDVNRYAAKPIAADPHAIRGLVYSGTVFVDRADEWARALGSVFPVDVQTREDGSVFLKPLPASRSSP